MSTQHKRLRNLKTIWSQRSERAVRRDDDDYDFDRLTPAQLERLVAINEQAGIVGIEALPIEDIVDMVTLLELARGEWPAGLDPFLVSEAERSYYREHLNRVARGEDDANEYTRETLAGLEALMRAAPAPPGWTSPFRRHHDWIR